MTRTTTSLSRPAAGAAGRKRSAASRYRPLEKQRVTRPIVVAIERRNERRAHKVYVTKLVGGPYQERGIPDLCCVYRSISVWFETKRDIGQEPTKIQRYTMRELRRSGAVAFVPDTVEQALSVFDLIDDFWDGDGPFPTLKVIEKCP